MQSLSFQSLAIHSFLCLSLFSLVESARSSATSGGTSSSLLYTGTLHTGTHSNATTNSTKVVETATVRVSGHNITETATFAPTTHPGYANLTSTIHTATVINITEGTSVVKSTYSYEIGPGGIGWTLPTGAVAKGAPLLDQPSFLPKNGSATKVSGTGSSTRSSFTGSGGKTRTASKNSTMASGTGTGSHAKHSTSPSGSTGLGHKTSSGTGGHHSGTAGVSSTTGTGHKTSSGASDRPTGASNSTQVSGNGTSIPTHASGNSSRSGSRGSASSHGATGTGGSAPTTSKASTTSGKHDSITGTISTVPSDFTGITLPGTTYTANEWITTTDSSSSTTLLPVIVLGGGRGIALWNLPPVPHVEFELPGIPEFHLPCIRIFGVAVAGDCSSPPNTDGPPPGSNPSKSNGQSSNQPSSTNPSSTGSSTSSSAASSTSVCSATSIVSDCVVSCVSTVSNSATCSSYTTSCTQVSAACSETGVTVTKVSSTGACLVSPATNTAEATQALCVGGCQLDTTYANGLPPNATAAAATTPTAAVTARAIAGRITMAPIQRRGAATTLSKFGNCALVTPAASPVVEPDYPNVSGDVYTPDIQNKLPQAYSTIPRWDRATKAGCVWTTTRLSAAEFSNAPSEGDVNNDRPSLDHAYEKDWLQLFFINTIQGNKRAASNAITCNQFNQYFLPSNNGCDNNLLQGVFDQLASRANLQFVAMSQFLNGAKSGFFPDTGQAMNKLYVGDKKYKILLSPVTNEKLPWAPVNDWLNNFFNYFMITLYGVLEMQSDGLLTMVDTTNNMIYKQLQDVDSAIKANPNDLFGDLTAFNNAFPNGISDQYKTFMTNNIQKLINDPPTYLTKLFQFIQTAIANTENMPALANDPAAKLQWERYYNIMAEHQNAYYDSQTKSYKWQYSYQFSFNTGNVKRSLSTDLLKRAGSCSLPSNITATEPAKSTGSGASSTSTSGSKTTSSLSRSSSLVTAPPKTTSTTNPPPTSTKPTTTTTAVDYCQGNQIEGSCSQASLPSQTPDSGPAAPVCNKVDSSSEPYLRFNATQAANAASQYCNNLVSGKVVLTASDTAPAAGIQPNAAENGGQIALSVLFDVGSCPQGTSAQHQNVDFGALGEDKCFQYLYTVIADGCAQDPTWGDYNPNYTLEGGVWGGYCALWSMAGQPSS